MEKEKKESKQILELVKDPYHHQEIYDRWKNKKTIRGLNEINKKISSAIFR
jgi:hypothetical protein